MVEMSKMPNWQQRSKFNCFCSNSILNKTNTKCREITTSDLKS